MAKKIDPIPLCPATPGISKKLSELTLSDRWVDGDKVRFVNGRPEKIGGFSKKTLSSVTDPIRDVRPWMTMRLEPFIAFGTHRKLYVTDTSNNPYDITPIDDSGTLTDPFTTASDSSLVIVEHVDHGRAVGDVVNFANAAAIGISGIVIDGAYTVASVLDEDHYGIEHSVSASATATGGGGVDYEYDLPIGSTAPLEGDGFGAGGFGLWNYGEPTEDASTIVFEPRLWNLHKYGDWMLANPVNGGIYKFDPAATPVYQRASRLANSPTVCRCMFVTRERFIFALGVDNDPMNIKWPDQDDPENWTPGADSTANSRRVTEGTRLIGGSSLASLLTGVWTDTALYRFQYTGSQFIYESDCVGLNCGLVSPLALVVNLSVSYWLSYNGNFFMWSGGAPQPIPNSDDVNQFVRRAMRTGGYEFKCNGHYNPIYNEIWWFFANTQQSEPGIYVAVSLSDFCWVAGTMQRTSGSFFENSDQRPILAGADGYLYQHEDGLNADGGILKAYIARAPLQLNNGAMLGEINGFINDMERQVGPASIDVTTYERIKSPPLDRERVSFEPDEELVDLRIGGRIASVTVRSEVLGGDFRLGNPMLEVLATGRRR